MLKRWEIKILEIHQDKSFIFATHGGCGTKWIAEMFNIDLGKRGTTGDEGFSTHVPKYISQWEGKWLYVYGDIHEAILSMYLREDMLTKNAICLKFGIKPSDMVSRLTYSDLNILYQKDPLGIERQFRSFENSSEGNVLMMKYPFSIPNLQKAAEYLEIDWKYIEYEERVEKPEIEDETLIEILDKYENLNQHINYLPEVMII
jgi:hypothetical protein